MVSRRTLSGFAAQTCTKDKNDKKNKVTVTTKIPFSKYNIYLAWQNYTLKLLSELLQSWSMRKNVSHDESIFPT